MRILHLSDFHYKSPSHNKFDQEKIVRKFIDELKKQNPLDLMFFTGDLVHDGSNHNHFREAKSELLDKIAEAIAIPAERVFLCQGNHDVNRKEVHESLKSYFDYNINNNQALNDFVRKKDFADYTLSLKPIDNYFSLIKEHYNNKVDRVEYLYTIHKRNISNSQVGIITINSAWRSFSDKDRSNLLFPVEIVKSALKEINDCKSKILLIHHPLFWFKDYNIPELQNLIHGSFNMIFSGHVHENQISSHFTSNNGVFAHVANATLTYEENKDFGFSIIEFSPDQNDRVTINKVKYLKSDDQFYYHEPLVVTIPCGQEKDRQNSFRKKITNKYEIELDNANELLLDQEIKGDANFLSLFNLPVLKTKPKSEITSRESAYNYDFTKLINSDENFLVFGEDKSGKTSLLKKIQLELLFDFSKSGSIPFYLDAKEIEHKVNDGFEIANLITKYYELNKRQTAELIKGHKFVLLVDNLNPKHHLKEKIESFLREYPNVNCIISFHQTIHRSIDNYSFSNKNFIKLFIHELGRKEIRKFSDRWGVVESRDKDAFLDKTIQLCKQLEMPVNYWTISLLLLIHKKTIHNPSKNLFEVLDLCVDEILNKKYLTLSRSRITFTQLKKLCSEIAHHLLINYKGDVYSISENKIRNYIHDYILDNPRLTANANEVFDYLVESGILKGKEEDLYTFRLNGLFEYFLAYFLVHNPEFKNQIIEDQTIFMSFKNELEIYSGFRRDDRDFLEKIFLKSKSFFEKINTLYLKQGSPDEILKSKTDEVWELSKAIDKLDVLKPLTSELQDELKEEFNPIETHSEVQEKKLYDIDNLSSDQYERYLSIIARVFRNSDEIKDNQLSKDIFDFLLDTYTNFGFFLMDEFGQEAKDYLRKINLQEIESEILKMVSNFTPTFTQASYFDGIGHFNIETLVLNKINELKADAENNQYKLFLLYFLLIDIDLRGNKKYIDELFDFIKIPTLKSSILLKLNYYFAFRAFNDPEMESILKSKIQLAQNKINSAIDKDLFNHRLSVLQKNNIVKKQIEDKS